MTGRRLLAAFRHWRWKRAHPAVVALDDAFIRRRTPRRIECSAEFYSKYGRELVTAQDMAPSLPLRFCGVELTIIDRNWPRRLSRQFEVV